MDDTPPRKVAGDVYAPLIEAMLAEEGARKASMEQRAISVITTSGALVSLLVALAAFLLGKNTTFHANTPSKYTLVGAVVLFVAAAILALLVNDPAAYRSFGPNDVKLMLATWSSDAETARKQISTAQNDFAELAIQKNNRKARLLQAAVVCEVLGVCAVALAVILALT
jgi:beta-lactamase class A